MDVGMYERAVENAAKVVHNTRPDQLDDPTPCTDWKVKDLLNHLVGGCEAIVTGYEGGTMRDFNEGDRLGDDYIGAFDRASKATVEVWKQPDSSDKVFKAPWGDTPGMVLFNLALADAIVHGWDLAQATGQEIEIEEEAAEAVYQSTTTMMEPKGPFPRMTAFAEPVEVPDDAPARDRAIAYLGRNPAG